MHDMTLTCTYPPRRLPLDIGCSLTWDVSNVSCYVPYHHITVGPSLEVSGGLFRLPPLLYRNMSAPSVTIMFCFLIRIVMKQHQLRTHKTHNNATYHRPPPPPQPHPRGPRTHAHAHVSHNVDAHTRARTCAQIPITIHLFLLPPAFHPCPS